MRWGRRELETYFQGIGVFEAVLDADDEHLLLVFCEY